MSGMLRVDLGGLGAMLEELGDRAEAAARPAAQAAAQVIYEQVKINVRRLGRKTGLLESSVYQAFWGKASGPGHATYRISWNKQKARHGHLVELGYIQRYQVHVGSGGRWYTVPRPEMRGLPKPRKSAPQAEKDAYYVLLDEPRHVGAKPFLRSAVVVFPAAFEAAKEKLLDEIL